MLFASCYNTNTLIPEFTGHILQRGGTEGALDMIYPKDEYDKSWKKDEGLGNIFSIGENPWAKLTPHIYFCKTINKKVAVLVFLSCMTIFLFYFSFSA